MKINKKKPMQLYLCFDICIEGGEGEEGGGGIGQLLHGTSLLVFA